jgi:hypothetical protein
MGQPWEEFELDQDTIARLNTISQELHTRAIALSHPNQDHDIAQIMSALAVTMEAVRSIGVTLNQMNASPGN